MRGRIVGLLSHRRSSIPPILTRFPSSAAVDRPFAALFSSPTPSGSSGDTASASDGRPPFQKISPEQGLPRDRPSIAAPGLSNHFEDLLPIRSASSASLSDRRSPQSFATPTGGAIGLRMRRFASASAERVDRWCWSCEHETSTGNGLLCPSCKAIQPLDSTVDFFQIFSIDRGFKVDLKELEQSYKSLQKRLHPDLAGSKSEREREYSAEQSAHVIQAYYILLRPLSRARYLLGLHCIKVDEEGTIDDPELLMEIMEIRESLDEISDAKALMDAQAANRDRVFNCEKELESSFNDGDFKRATSWTQRLAYFIKVGEEILRKL